MAHVQGEGDYATVQSKLPIAIRHVPCDSPQMLPKKKKAVEIQNGEAAFEVEALRVDGD